MNPLVCSKTHLRVHSRVGQNGTSRDDKLRAMATTDDESVIVVGFRGDNNSFVAVKLDEDGTQVWQWEVSHVLP